MAVCASVLVLAGLVAVVAGAVDADRATSLRLAVAQPAPVPAAPGPVEPAPTGPGGPAPEAERVTDAATATSVVVPPGWRVATFQQVVEVPAGRFPDATTVQRGEDAVVLVGLADPGRVPARADPAAPDPAGDEALDAEARRLADAYADLLAPGADTAALADGADGIADLPTRTSVRRVEGGALDGALVRVSTLAAPGRTLAVLAVVRPSAQTAADGDAADLVVRSLRLEPGPTS
ncbi:hypothetical protein GCM10023200_33740 [Actinomycetospora chlora]|uniref:Uncharacterized protein n=1 Tax=Actinomycetospora chlora TaxID=663608 RepID=A0ABP9BHC9_9PSEU